MCRAKCRSFMYRRNDILVNRAFEDVIKKSAKPRLCFIILGLLRLTLELGEDFAGNVYADLTGNSKPSRYYVRKVLDYLIDEGLINQTESANTIDGKAKRWEFTNKFHLLEDSESRYYKTIADMENYMNVVDTVNDQYLSKYSTELIEADYHSEWRNTLEEKHTDQFIPALAELETRKYLYDYDRMLVLNGRLRENIDSFPKVLKQRRPFRIKYKPQKTGRLTAQPHIYFNKPLRQFIVPSEDPGLNKGGMFSIDYSAQEFRILASIINNSYLNNLIQNSDNFWQDIIKELDPPAEYANKKFIKRILLSTVYGSNGNGAVDLIFKTWKEKDEYIKKKVIGDNVTRIMDRIKNLIPEIAIIRDGLIDEYENGNDIVFQDGIEFQRSYTEKGRRKPLRYTILNNKIQSIGSAIIRRVIINADNMKNCRLHFPVHDAAVFYVPDESNYDKALIEATKLMVETAKEVIGDTIPMPVDVEWERGFEHANN